MAAILADYRMPQMNGVEFLEQAMDLYPYARRVLLTAYADTEAAIQAINVVDLDHYLLKPWDPPEEKFYPVLDAQLDAWQRTDRRESDELRVVGARWSAPSYEVRDFLSRNQVPYRWMLADSPEGAELLAAAGGGGRGPGEAAADHHRRRYEAHRAEPLGAGPGRGAVHRPGHRLLRPDRDRGRPRRTGRRGLRRLRGAAHRDGRAARPGGQAGQSSRIENYLGFPDGVSGAQLADRARRQATKFGAELLTARTVTSLEVKGRARVVGFADGGTIAAHTVILATGVSYRRLNAPGLDDFIGSGCYYGAAMTEAPSA